MKKMILFGLVCFTMMMSSLTASATLLGISVHYKKGTKEWNGTKTSTDCVGRGICEFSIDLGAYQPGGDGAGTLGLNENGQLGLSFDAAILRDPYWMETFANGQVYIGKDIPLGNEIRNAIKNCPSAIKAGNYRYTVKGNLVTVLF